MIKALRQVPLLGPAGSSLARFIRMTGRKLRGKDRSGRDPYVFQRQTLTPGENFHVTQILNLLNYTKTSGTIFNGQQFPAGYHTIDIAGLKLQGQRNLQERFTRIPVDFTGKTVLDLGCNQGGMLFAVADKIKHGIGVDYDKRVVNAANKIKTHTGNNHLEFFTLNLEEDNLDVIRDLLPAEKVDITFLLAVCVYLDNWKDVIDLTTEISKSLLFESNGRPDQQAEQVEYLRQKYKNVQLLTEQSDDRFDRKLYLCS